MRHRAARRCASIDLKEHLLGTQAGRGGVDRRQLDDEKIRDACRRCQERHQCDVELGREYDLI